jgi:two-component system, OmpR family, response regulator
MTTMRILVVEDEHKIANSIKQGLEQEGFAVDVVYTGSEGYDYATTEAYDLIILDLMLPDMSGMEICTNLRNGNNHTPVIMLTARSEVGDRVKGLNCGADDYITKPFSFTELLARIRALLRRPINLVPNKLICESLKIDTIEFTVTRDGKDIELSKKEFALLEYLARNKNKIVTKDRIIEHVWNYDADVLPNTVEVYVGYLRNKIERPFKKLPTMIKTVRGFGYKLVEPSKNSSKEIK